MDDWGRPIGSDPDEVVTPRPKKVSRQDSTMGLSQYFSDLLPRDAWGSLNSPVNHKALSVGISKLRKAGKTPEEIRGMMETFIANIKRTPLPMGVAPWRGFLANLDSLASKATTRKEQSYDDIDVDPRI
jgi:hypothetical protein